MRRIVKFRWHPLNVEKESGLMGDYSEEFFLGCFGVLGRRF